MLELGHLTEELLCGLIGELEMARERGDVVCKVEDCLRSGDLGGVVSVELEMAEGLGGSFGEGVRDVLFEGHFVERGSSIHVDAGFSPQVSRAGDDGVPVAGNLVGGHKVVEGETREDSVADFCGQHVGKVLAGIELLGGGGQLRGKVRVVVQGGHHGETALEEGCGHSRGESRGHSRGAS